MCKPTGISLVALVVAILGSAAIGLAQEQAKWFVLRDHQIELCWTALLIKVDGSYRHGFAQTARGPFDTEEQALERMKALQAASICQP